ncbi:MAG: hypothetical protein LBK58_10385 [Prevotellaceae bacterium]|jgi:hypothetical protein|nr:hypothetical protein [Prevotellaceae bacterium]
MTELIIKNDVGKKKMKWLLFFLKSWDIEVEIKPVMEISRVKKVKRMNKLDVLTDEQLSEKLLGEVLDMSSCSDSDCREVIKNHRPVFSNGLE